MALQARSMPRMLLARSLPVLVLLLLVVFLRVPMVPVWQGALVPDAALIYVFYFVLHRPSRAPLWLVFLVGLVIDLVDGTPLGLSAVIYFRSANLILSQRIFFRHRSFAVTWIGFAVIALMAKALEWAALMLVMRQVLAPQPLITEMFATVLAYPILAWIFARVDRGWLR